jgi:hypothetical protein
MRKACAGLLALALTALGGPAMAQNPAPVDRPVTTARTPNFLGASGLLFAPSAYAETEGNWTAFIYGHENFVDGGLRTGLIRDQLEVGFTVIGFDGGDTEFLGNAKWNFLRETDSRPAVAVGVIDAFDQLDVDPSFYVVASKYFTRSEIEQRFALKGHVGWGMGIFDDEFFAGAELFFDRNLSAMVEFVNDDFNIGARYTHRGFAFTIGLFDWDDFGGGVAYTARFR